MKVEVYVENIEWMEGCDDEPGHSHPDEFVAVVSVSDALTPDDPLALEAAVHEAVIDQCECCVVEADFQILSLGGRVVG